MDARELAAGADAAGDDELSWSAWPARRRPLAALVLLGGAAVLVVLIVQATGDRVLGVAAPLFELRAVSSFPLPTGYRLTRDAVDVRSLGVVRARSWSEM